MTEKLDENVRYNNVSDPHKMKDGNLLETMPSYAPGSLSQINVDPELEKRSLRKFDIFLLPQLALVTIVAYLDRTNLGEH